MRAVLSAHSQISLINESELLAGLVEAGLDTEGRDVDRAALMEKLREYAACGRHIDGLDPAAREAFVAERAPLTFAEAYEALLPRDPRSTVWGEKTIDGIWCVDSVLRNYPDALVVHLMRDPRATSLSHYRKRWGKKPVECDRATIRLFTWLAKRWDLRMQAVADVGRVVPDESLIEIPFESFVREPEESAQGICERLGVPYEPEMLGAAQRKEDPVFASTGAHAHQNLRGEINPERAAASRELPDWAGWVVSKFSGMERYGYVPTPRPKGPKGRKAQIESTLWLAHPELRERVRKERARMPKVVSG